MICSGSAAAPFSVALSTVRPIRRHCSRRLPDSSERIRRSFSVPSRGGSVTIIGSCFDCTSPRLKPQGIETLNTRLDTLLIPYRPAIARLCTIPGVSDIVAQSLLAELGADMGRFPGPGHVRSWVGLCPRLDESAGKRRSTRVRHGAPWLKTVLVQAAWAAIRHRQGYPHAQFQRLKAKRGPKKAIVAVAASLLTAAYFVLRDSVDYHDLGAHYFDRHDAARAATRLTKRLEALGFKVQLTAA